MTNFENLKISVTGLGYVGLPVAVYMADHFSTVGFDINEKRVRELQNSKDITGEVEGEALKKAHLTFTSNISDLSACNFHIVAVPTPVDDANVPDLRALVGASKSVGQILKKGDIVVYESTVFPGATEDICLPVLESVSRLKQGDFSIAYSPERINPGDREHSFTKIKKVVSADSPEALEVVAQVYGRVVEAGIFKAETIKVAEAAKVIENTQRDINIALINELTLLCDKMDIDIYSVLEAAETKWNFLNFKPGLVGGHCIGVDPYYLTHKATQLGYHPEVILAGRRINDSMAKYVAQKAIKILAKSGLKIKDSRVNILGLTFKENCPDLRNTKVIDVIKELTDYGVKVSVTDPWADPQEAVHEYNIELTPFDELPKADLTLIAVKHKQFVELGLDSLNSPIVFDLKGIYRNYRGEKHLVSL